MLANHMGDTLHYERFLADGTVERARAMLDVPGVKGTFFSHTSAPCLPIVSSALCRENRRTKGFLLSDLQLILDMSRGVLILPPVPLAGSP